MEVIIKPVSRKIEVLTISNEADTISQESVFTLCDKLLSSSFVEFEGATFSAIRLPEFICALNRRFKIDLNTTYNHYERELVCIWEKQQECMDELKVFKSI